MKSGYLFLSLFLLILKTPILLAQAQPFYAKELAIYRIGEGKPLLLMPYPHASAYHPMYESPLVEIFNDLGYSVLTFDPPGIYNSKRKSNVTLNEMLSCANEVLDFFKIKDSVLIAGHSQSGFCSIAYAVENPVRVNKMILIGSVSGWPAVRKMSIHKQFGWFTKQRWQMMYWGTRKMLKISNLLIHKKLDKLVWTESFYNKSKVPEINYKKTDRSKKEPIRAKWMVNLRKFKYDYSEKIKEIDIPVLICVGKFDAQTPLEVNQELHIGIKNSEIHIFEKSGHCPFIEEKNDFASIIKNWLNI